MFPLLCFILAILASPFKSRIRLEAENAALRRQLIAWSRNLAIIGTSVTIVCFAAMPATS